MKKRFGVTVILGLIMLFAVAAFAARLPTVNSDNNGWGDLLNEYLGVAHDSGGNVRTSHITSAMIVDATIAAADLASSSVNTTHIVDNTVAGVDIANATIESIDIAMSVINGTHIANSAGINVSTVIVSINKTRGPETNITGIYINSSYIDLPSISAGNCVLANINMTGLPGNAMCFAYVDPSLENLATGNLTIVGVNSTQGNCRLRVCNAGGLAAINPGNSLYGAMAIVTS